jgi:hypothetical protein
MRELFLAHVYPYLAIEIADLAVVGKLFGICPTPKRLQISNPRRNADGF